MVAIRPWNSPFQPLTREELALGDLHAAAADACGEQAEFRLLTLSGES